VGMPSARHLVGTRYLTFPLGVPSGFIPISLIPNLSFGGGGLCCSASTVLTRKKTFPISFVRAVPHLVAALIHGLRPQPFCFSFVYDLPASGPRGGYGYPCIRISI
jgi:hypothetical protein